MEIKTMTVGQLKEVLSKVPDCHKVLLRDVNFGFPESPISMTVSAVDFEVVKKRGVGYLLLPSTLQTEVD